MTISSCTAYPGNTNTNVSNEPPTRKRDRSSELVDYVALRDIEQRRTLQNKRQRRLSLEVKQFSAMSLAASSSDSSSLPVVNISYSTKSKQKTFLQDILRNSKNKQTLVLECCLDHLLKLNQQLVKCTKLKNLTLRGDYFTGSNYQLNIPKKLERLVLKDQHKEVRTDFSHFLLSTYEFHFPNSPIRKSVAVSPNSTEIQLKYSLSGTFILVKVYKNGGLYMESQVTNNILSGLGKIYYSDGSLRYHGHLINGVPNGIGKYYRQNGDWFHGEFIDGFFSGAGIGKVTFESSDYYEGQFFKGEFHGKGTYYGSNGSQEESGIWTWGQKDGVFHEIDHFENRESWSFWTNGNLVEPISKPEEITTQLTDELIGQLTFS